MHPGGGKVQSDQSENSNVHLKAFLLERVQICVENLEWKWLAAEVEKAPELDEILQYVLGYDLDGSEDQQVEVRDTRVNKKKTYLGLNLLE